MKKLLLLSLERAKHSHVNTHAIDVGWIMLLAFGMFFFFFLVGACTSVPGL